MRVYLLYRVEWHDVDGENTYLVNVYSRLQDAQDKRDQLYESDGVSKISCGVYFEVVEEYVL